jgi:hypothetical protein
MVTAGMIRLVVAGVRRAVACGGWPAAVAVLTAVAVATARSQDIAFPPPDVSIDCPPTVNRSCCGPLCHVLDPLGQDPVWTGRAEALLLWRSQPQGLPLFNSFNGTAQGPALNAANFASGMAAGPRFTLFRHTGDDGAFEFNYFRVQSFQAQTALPDTEGGYQLADLEQGIFCCPTLDPFNSVSGGLSSGFQSFELNRRLPTEGRLQWLAGFRWVQWNEQIGITGVYTALPNAIQGYRTATNNDLYGLQIGADSILYGLGGPFRIEGIGKSGIFYNQAGQSSLKTYSGDPPFVEPYTLSNRSSTARGAFVGEIGATAVYDITSWLTVRAGYAAFWLGGLALGSNQFDDQCLCPTEPVRAVTDTGGSVFVHGLTLGLEGRW